MNDQDKTKEELVNELMAIRQRVAELEESLVTLTERVEAGQEVEAISKAMIQGFPGLVYVFSPSHGIELVNQRFIQLAGYSPRGEKYYQVLHDLEGISPWHINEKVQQGETVRSEVRSPKDNRWYHVINIPLRHQNNATSKMVMIEDITERKQAEEAVRRSEERLELALKGADLGMWDYNLQTGEAVVNARRAEMVGYSVDELGPHFSSWGKLIHPDDIDRVINAFNAHVEGRTRLYECEHRLRHKSGRYIWILARGKVVKWDKQGNPVRIVGTSLDVTDGKTADEALREGRQRLELALEGARIGFWDWDALRDEAVVNDRAANIVGYSLGEITPTSQLWESLIHPDDKPRVAEAYNAYLKGHTDYFEAEYRMLAKSGEWKWILSRGKIVERDQEMRPLRMAGTFMDITDPKRAEDALRKSEQRNRLLIEQSPIGIGIVQAGSLTYVNPALLKTFGYDHPDEVLGKPPENFIAPEDRELISESQKDRLDGKALPLSYEVDGLKKNGDRFDLAIWPRRIEYFGEPAILAFIADRTEAKQLRMQLV